LHFKCANVDATVHHARKTGAALIVIGRRSKVRVAHVNGWTSRQQCVRECGAAVVLQGPEHRMSVDLVAWTSQKAAAVIPVLQEIGREVTRFAAFNR
jgi:hypothetical protein